MNSIDQTVLKDKITQSHILSDKEKSEWLFLLPKMNEEQIEELEQILSLVITLPIGQPQTRADFTRTATAPPTSPFIPPHHLGRDIGAVTSLQEMERGGREVGGLDYLRSLSLETLRREPSTHTFFLDIKKKIEALRLTTPPHLIKKAFEESPLHKAYLEAGLTALSGASQNKMGHIEFEMVTDFRAELRKLLS